MFVYSADYIHKSNLQHVEALSNSHKVTSVNHKTVSNNFAIVWKYITKENYGIINDFFLF
jgi:hypothetical protein